MPIAPPVSEEFDYTLKSERDIPKGTATVFRLRTLSYLEREEIARQEWKQGKDDEIKLVSDQLGLARRILSMALLGWSRFKDKAGNDVEFTVESSGPRRALSPSTLARIAPWAVEIANAVTLRSQVSEDLAKNSGSP